MELSEKALRLLTSQGFDSEYFANLATSNTQLEAYEKTELLYQSFFKKRRYSTFASFKTAHYMRINKSVHY